MRERYSESFAPTVDTRPNKFVWLGTSKPFPAFTFYFKEDAHGLCGTVHLVLDMPENQPHRADVTKMLVHRRARRRGVATALMRAAEATARDCGRTLLVLDTVTGSDADRLYQRLGWQRVGAIPGYALFPRGGLCSATFFCRALAD